MIAINAMLLLELNSGLLLGSFFVTSLDSGHVLVWFRQHRMRRLRRRRSKMTCGLECQIPDCVARLHKSPQTVIETNHLLRMTSPCAHRGFRGGGLQVARCSVSRQQQEQHLGYESAQTLTSVAHASHFFAA